MTSTGGKGFVFYLFSNSRRGVDDLEAKRGFCFGGGVISLTSAHWQTAEVNKLVVGGRGVSIWMAGTGGWGAGGVSVDVCGSCGGLVP